MFVPKIIPARDPKQCKNKMQCMWYHSMCDHSMWPLYVTTLCEHSMCDHSMWALYVWPLYVCTLCVSTLCEHSMWPLYVHAMCDHSMCDHSMWARYVWPLFVTTLCVSTPCVSTMCALYVWALYVSSWAGCCRRPTSTKITFRLQFFGRILQRQKRQKSTEFYCKNTVQEHWRTPKSTRITTKNEHRRSWRAGNDENLQTKAVGAGRRQAETTKIHRRNEHASTKPRK